jgi:RNA polymerase sigma factor (sigma-70 family)
MQWNDIHSSLTELRSGNSQAWSALDPLVRPFLMGRAAKKIGPGWPEQSCSDLVQETLRRAADGLENFAGGPTPEDTAAAFRAWIGTILNNQVIKWHEARQADKRVPPGGQLTRLDHSTNDQSTYSKCPPSPDPTPSVLVSAGERLTGVSRALATLQPIDRVIIQRLFFEEKTVAAVAEELTLSADQVRYRKDKILETLGTDLKEFR